MSALPPIADGNGHGAGGPLLTQSGSQGPPIRDTLSGRRVDHRTKMGWLMAALSASLARQVVGDFEPGNPVSMKPMPVGNIVVGIIQCADVKIDH